MWWSEDEKPFYLYQIRLDAPAGFTFQLQPLAPGSRLGSRRNDAMRKKLVLSALSILLTLLVAEGAMRLLGVGSAGRGSSWFAGGNHPRFLFQPDPASVYTLRPGFRGREIALGGEFDVPVAVADRGESRACASSRTRLHSGPGVLIVGDSMTFGEGVHGRRRPTRRCSSGRSGYASTTPACRATAARRCSAACAATCPLSAPGWW